MCRAAGVTPAARLVLASAARKPWARVPAIVVGILGLLNFPITVPIGKLSKPRMPTTIAGTRAQGFRAADASTSRAAGVTPAARHMVVTPAAREGEVSITRVARSGGYQQ